MEIATFLVLISITSAYLMMSTATLEIVKQFSNETKSKRYFKLLAIFCFFFWPIPLVILSLHWMLVTPFKELYKTLRGE